MPLQLASRPWKIISDKCLFAFIVTSLLSGCGIFSGPTIKTSRTYTDRVPSNLSYQQAGLVPPGWTPTHWSQLPGWNEDALDEAWSAFMRGCRVLQRQPGWRSVCDEGRHLALHPAVVRRFIEERFVPYQYTSSPSYGLMTGYYEPLFLGSRQKTARFRYPLYGIPDDLIRLKPIAKLPNSRGRRDNTGNIVPYWTRQDIETGRAKYSLAGKEIVYLENPIDVFIAHVQGSVKIRLENNQEIQLGYADANGYPYKSIGRFMIDQGLLPPGQASMPGIKKWLERNPDRLPMVLGANPSYIFFKEQSAEAEVGPLGSLGVPLTPMRSIAVDPSHIPLGSLVYMSSSTPDKLPLQRLVVAQDVGSAIQGPQRADFFWGMGNAAGEQAGRSKHTLNLWLLLPRL